ncbi:WD40 repeat-containing protein [Cavenderia fasciculata]|uniref:WD40 repeat-containing protein n=1 Tax=Cavenderia fasciculata TaxID=261658 RepID=F4Q7V1_CACFS|nr:WD40 repeat-containing protein [Cavenderia fasciculata]EGG15851.1 WD40 repeat-containing protein [Cavenderia fasciculata]|eukprot:XP_004352176.1 WD40 repeat-containing protein [Cavenderia fasciculata]
MKKIRLEHSAPVLSVRFNYDGQYCMTGSQDRLVRLWNPAKGLRVHTFEGHGYQVLDVAATRDSRFLLSCAEKQLYQWDVATGEIIRKFRGHPQTINTIALGGCPPNSSGTDNQMQQAQDNLLATGSYDKTVKIWDMRSRSSDAIQTMEEAQDSVTSVLFNDQDYELLSSSVDGSIRVYDIRNSKVIIDQLHHPLSSIYITHDGKCLLTCTMNSTISLLEKKTGDVLNEFKGHKNNSYKVNSKTLYDDSLVVSGSEDNQVYLWDIVEGTIFAKLDHSSPSSPPNSIISSIDCHPSQRVILSCSTDGIPGPYPQITQINNNMKKEYILILILLINSSLITISVKVKPLSETSLRGSVPSVLSIEKTARMKGYLEVFNNFLINQEGQDLFTGKINPLQIIRSVTVTGLSLIPEVGGVLSFGADLIFSHFSQDNSTAELINKEVQKAINEKLGNYNYVDLNDQLEVISSSIATFRRTVSNFKANPTDDNKSFMIAQYDSTYNSLKNDIRFLHDTYSISEAPLFVLMASTKLMFLADGIVNAEEYHISGQVNILIDDFRDSLDKYIRYSLPIYEKGLAKMAKTKDPVKDYNDRTEYFNQMLLGLYDTVNIFWAMDPVMFPKGVITENVRYLYSDVVGKPTNERLDRESKGYLQYRMKDFPLDSADKIKAKFDTLGFYNYQKQLKGANIYCWDRIDSIQSVFFDYSNTGQPKTRTNNKIGGTGGALKKLDLTTPISSIIVSSENDIWKLNVGGQIFGKGDPRVHDTNLVAKPGHKIGLFCPIGIDVTEGFNSLSSMSIGFVDESVIDENIVVVGTGNMFDVQKYYTKSSNAQFIFNGMSTGLSCIKTHPDGSNFDYYISSSANAKYRVIIYGRGNVGSQIKVQVYLAKVLVGSTTFIQPITYGRAIDTGIDINLVNSKYNDLRITISQNSYNFASFVLRNN